MKELFSSTWDFISKNKYAVTIGAFLLIIVFMDSNRFIRRVSQKRQMKALQEEIDMYRAQIEEGSSLLDNIGNDSMLLERIAREKYNMSRPDEDVFLIER